MSDCVLDTSIVSLLFRRSPLIAPYRRYLAGTTAAISFQTIGEMRFGARRAN